MTDIFYTDVQVVGSRILYRGVENGQRVRRRIDYSPSLFVSSKEKTQFETIYGEYVSEIKPGNIKDCRDFIKKYEDVANFKIYGNTKFEYSFIFDSFRDDVKWNINQIRIANLDIEVGNNQYAATPSKKIKIRRKK
jgi:hypothetical protein